jgi:hypothetical protein
MIIPVDSTTSLVLQKIPTSKKKRFCTLTSVIPVQSGFKKKVQVGASQRFPTYFKTALLT